MATPSITAFPFDTISGLDIESHLRNGEERVYKRCSRTHDRIWTTWRTTFRLSEKRFFIRVTVTCQLRPDGTFDSVTTCPAAPVGDELQPRQLINMQGSHYTRAG